MSGAIILAAGASTRLGSPKQLVTLNGETLLDRAIRMAHQAGCFPVIVVLGASSSLIEQGCVLQHAKVVRNDRWTEGMASAIRLGIETLAQYCADGVVILTCDMPAVDSCHLRCLHERGVVTASHYAGRNGIPAFFPHQYFPDLLRLQGEIGARELLQKAASIDLLNGDMDIDTPEDLSRMTSEATMFGDLIKVN